MNRAAQNPCRDLAQPQKQLLKMKRYLLFWWHPDTGCHHELTFDAESEKEARDVAHDRRCVLGHPLALDLADKHQCWELT